MLCSESYSKNGGCGRDGMKVCYETGDRVVIVEGGWGCSDIHVGKVGKITYESGGDFGVRLDDGTELYDLWEHGFRLVTNDFEILAYNFISQHGLLEQFGEFIKDNSK
jgi:hypothetical protein